MIKKDNLEQTKFVFLLTRRNKSSHRLVVLYIVLETEVSIRPCLTGCNKRWKWSYHHFGTTRLRCCYSIFNINWNRWLPSKTPTKKKKKKKKKKLINRKLHFCKTKIIIKHLNFQALKRKKKRIICLVKLIIHIQLNITNSVYKKFFKPKI